MYVLFRKIFVVDRAPGNWNESRVCLLHKGGYKDKKELKNYRPIAITNAISKVFCGLLNERMTSLVESNNLLSEEQNGFRGDRRGTDNLFILNEVMETYRRKKKKMFCVFLDIEKAYDRIEREVLWEILRRAGFEEKIINIIKSLYDNTKAKYSLGTLQSDWAGGQKERPNPQCRDTPRMQHNIGQYHLHYHLSPLRTHPILLKLLKLSKLYSTKLTLSGAVPS